LALPATLAYDYPSIKTLTAYLQTFFVAKVWWTKIKNNLIYKIIPRK
jgi:hypothetical protein